MAFFLIGFGVGALMVVGINYKEQSKGGIIPTKYILIFGILSFIVGLVMAFT